MVLTGINATVVRAVGGVAVALLVVGAGAAVGMGASGSGHPAPLRPQAGPAAPAGSGPATSAPSTTAPVSTDTTAAGSRAVPVVSSRSGPTGGSQGQAGGASARMTPPTTAAPGHDQVVTGPAPGPGTTPPGTYTYDTSGSSTLFSKTTPYPSRTTIVVSREGCGVSARWDSSAGNSSTVYECPVAGGVHVISETATVDAGGYQQTMTFTCDPDSFVPTSGTPGRTWTWACHSSNGETSTQVVKLVGPQTMTVAGAPVATEHVQIVSTLSGPQQGTATTDYWLTPDATPVHEVGSITASQYGVTYRSNYTLQLESLSPSG